MILCPCDPEPDNGGDIIPETAGGTGETFRIPPDTAAPSELDKKCDQMRLSGVSGYINGKIIR